MKHTGTLIAGLMGLALFLNCNPTSSDSSSNDSTVKDVDGNVYHMVKIGTQTWTVENLKTTHYNDGTAIPRVTDSAAWVNLTTPGYCWYNNDAATNKTTYGALYNWYAVNTDKLAPKGWHVPTTAEWDTLATYLGGVAIAGGKLKETDTTHWYSPNTGATNESGFFALPGGSRDGTGSFDGIGYAGNWWCTAVPNASGAFYRSIYFYSNHLDAISGATGSYGFSVRALRN